MDSSFLSFSSASPEDGTEEENSFEEYTPAALEDEVVYEISSARHITNVNDIYTKQEYANTNLDYAKKFLYRFFICNYPKKKGFHVSEFQIRILDLKPELVETLEKLDSKELNTLMTRVVQTLLEGVDHRYYHTSGIHGKIAWRFVKFICQS